MASDALNSERELVLMMTHARGIAAQPQRVPTLLNGLISSDTVREVA